MTLATKSCFRCSETKPVSEFHGKPGGYSSYCKPCKAANDRQWRATRREKDAEQYRNWKAANPEKVAEYKRRWEKNNPEKVVENQRRWHEANAEAVAKRHQEAYLSGEKAASQRRWEKNNPGNGAERNRRYAERYPERAAARKALDRALKVGQLHSASTCEECGTVGPTTGHHWSYLPEHQLDVIWLCFPCHGATRRKFHRPQFAFEARLLEEDE